MGHEKVKQRRIVDKAFAQRLDDVCNDNPLIPPKNHGRLGYIAKEMEKVTGEKYPPNLFENGSLVKRGPGPRR